ncbi:hypothetical protein BJY52DRAFT_1205620 [Lactarius psammicola]|nr:hypothetical protein BJY52DRAFT_1205620 [Lactarius psammicola]
MCCDATRTQAAAVVYIPSMPVHTNSNIWHPASPEGPDQAQADSEDGDDGHSRGCRGPVAQRIEHPYLTGICSLRVLIDVLCTKQSIALPCDSDGNHLPLGTPPPPQAVTQKGDWTPFKSEAQFMVAELLYHRAEVSAGNVDRLMDIWARSSVEANKAAPFESHKHMLATINTSKFGDVSWQCLVTGFSGNWKRTSFKVWYPNMLANPDFAGNFDLRPYININTHGQRNIAWQHSDDIFTSDNSTKGSMYCPIILGSDKTTVLVAMGQVEYHPLYLSIGNPHNTIHHAHWNTVTPIAFLAIPKGDRNSDDNSEFCTFKCQLYHVSVAAILSTLRPSMETPVVHQCPDGHFRHVIYNLVAFIADYLEQVLLTGIVQGWCPKCTAMSGNLEAYAGCRTPMLTDELIHLLMNSTGENGTHTHRDKPFTLDFPHADIYEMISPDLLHQVIKGTFKDHLVTWICAILNDIDRRIVAVPPFPQLCQFPQGRRFKQWTGDNSKALIKMYLPTIVGYVPEDMVQCMSAFLDACYIAHHQDINNNTLNDFKATLGRFMNLCEVFCTSGVRPTGFALPRQHSLVHYCCQVKDFGTPGGLCSSITESCHIMAVKKPWHCSNCFEALGQMLKINQCLDKISAQHSRYIELGPDGNDSNSEDEGAVKGDVVMGYVILAQKHAARKYPQDINSLSLHINKPNLHFLTQVALAQQLNIDVDDVPPINSTISVFHLAVATFHAPSDPSGTCGMRRERIQSTPSWRGHGPRRDCTFIVEDDDKSRMRGLGVVRVFLFSFEYDNTHYPFAFVEWFKKVGLDPMTGMWVVRPDIVCGRQEHSVVHLDAFLRAAHLILVFGAYKLPHDFHFTFSLNAFDVYYINK